MTVDVCPASWAITRSGAEFSGATPGRGRQRVDDSPAGRVVDRSPLEPPRVAGMGYKGAGGYNGKTFKLPGATSPAISPAQSLGQDGTEGALERIYPAGQLCVACAPGAAQ